KWPDRSPSQPCAVGAFVDAASGRVTWSLTSSGRCLKMQRRDFIAMVGSAMAWPLAAHAQRRPMPVIGYLHFATPNYIPASDSFLRGLKEFGFVEGQNVA